MLCNILEINSLYGFVGGKKEKKKSLQADNSLLQYSLCPGFVQISSKLIRGLPFDLVSAYNGSKYEMAISIYQVNNLHFVFFFFNNAFLNPKP